MRFHGSLDEMQSSNTAVRWGRPAALIGGAAALTLLTACNPTTVTATISPSSVSGAAAPVTGSGSSTPTSAAGMGTTGSSGSTGSGSGDPASTRCTDSALKASVGANNPGAGQENFPITLTNTSPSSCTIYGFPGIAFENSSHQALTPDPTRGTGVTPSVIHLVSGASVSAGLTFSNPLVSGAKSVTPTVIAITPPDEKNALYVTWTSGTVPSGGNASGISVLAFSVNG